MKIVRIEWIDSESEDGYWKVRDVIHSHPSGVLECSTVGYVIREDEYLIELCQSEHECEYGAVFRIPKCSVRKIEVLREESGG